jgi:predicted  nucleic acid-binding Zn-ribbon protein
MNTCNIPVSIGELFDKFTILLLKQKNVKDADKLNNINKELNYLKEQIDNNNKLYNELFDELYNINKKLWEIEDNIRIKEYNKQFDDEFINLARNVYINNDERALLKNKINNYFNSEIIEIKEYYQYN